MHTLTENPHQMFSKTDETMLVCVPSVTTPKQLMLRLNRALAQSKLLSQPQIETKLNSAL